MEFDIVRQSNPTKSFRVQSIVGMYDLQQDHQIEHFKGEIDLPKEWNIGLIVGRSGSGKSTIVNHLFADYVVKDFDYSHDNILDDMPKDCSVNEIAKTFNAVGFSSPPSWLKPYAVLSNGEKMRVDLARAILEKRDLFCFDEFTSVVDRNVAKIGSLAMQKAIRKSKKKFVAVTCHYDVEEWLMPDWVFDTDTMTFHNYEGQKKNKPELRIDIYETKDKFRFWNAFKKYHYLDSGLNKSAKVFVAFANGYLCGFTSALQFPHPKIKNVYRLHRTVIFPDYQGVGIGSILTNNVAQMYIDDGKSIISTSSNPAIINARKNSSKWIITHIGRASVGSSSGKIQNKNKKGSTSSNRITCSFRFIGDGKV